MASPPDAKGSREGEDRRGSNDVDGPELGYPLVERRRADRATAWDGIERRTGPALPKAPAAAPPPPVAPFRWAALGHRVRARPGGARAARRLGDRGRARPRGHHRVADAATRAPGGIVERPLALRRCRAGDGGRPRVRRVGVAVGAGPRPAHGRGGLREGLGLRRGAERRGRGGRLDRLVRRRRRRRRPLRRGVAAGGPARRDRGRQRDGAQGVAGVGPGAVPRPRPGRPPHRGQRPAGVAAPGRPDPARRRSTSTTSSTPRSAGSGT